MNKGRLQELGVLFLYLQSNLKNYGRDFNGRVLSNAKGFDLSREV